jgi:hypothetical protein
VGIGVAGSAGEASDPGAEPKANEAPAAAVVLMNLRLVCSLTITIRPSEYNNYT